MGLMVTIEDLKVAMYSRDKTIEIMEDEAKNTSIKLTQTMQLEIQCKKLIVENESLNKAN